MSGQPNTIIRVIIADDHAIYLDGLKLLLEKEADIEVAGMAENGRQLTELVMEMQPDVVLTDMQMPLMNGITAVQQLRRMIPDLRAVMLSSCNSDQQVMEALEAGALGYVVKNSQRNEVVEAVRTVYQFRPYYCRSTSALLARMVSCSNVNPYEKNRTGIFNRKDREIIRYLCEGKTSKEIGEIIFASPRTVDRWRSAILEKMKVKTSMEIVIYAIKNGLYSLPLTEG